MVPSCTALSHTPTTSTGCSSSPMAAIIWLAEGLRLTPFSSCHSLCTTNDFCSIHSYEKIPYTNWTLFHNTSRHTTRSKGNGRTAIACAVVPATGNRRRTAAIPRSHFFTGVAVDLNRLAENASFRKKFCEKSHCLAQQKFS